MTQEDQVFVANVVVINSMKETMASNVISRPVGATMKFKAIAKIRRYRGLHEGHHFISMAMEVHGAFGREMDCFIGVCLFFPL